MEVQVQTLVCPDCSCSVWASPQDLQTCCGSELPWPGSAAWSSALAYGGARCVRECTHLWFLAKQRTSNSAIILQPKVSSHGHNLALRAEADSELPSPHADAVLRGKVKCQREWQQKLGIPQFSYCNTEGYNKIKAHNWIEYESGSCKIPYCSAWSK